MIRRSVRKSFRGVYWIPPAEPIPGPAIFVPNHHGWHDGYVMYHLVSALGLRTLDWIAEFDAFPLFARVGGMPYPPGDPGRRAATVKRTIRLMRTEGRSLLLFAEADLHRPPELLRFGKALETVARSVPGSTVVPVGIRYEMSLHERPECWVLPGRPVESGEGLAERTRWAVGALLDEIAVKVRFEPEAFQTLVRGTKDVNERMDMRRMGGRGGR